MRILTAVLVVICLAVPLASQGNAATLQQKEKDRILAEKAKEVQAELQKVQYKAKVDIPAVDCIFVQDGKIIQGMYQSYLRDNPKALSAGGTTKVSKVSVMEQGVQVYLANDSFAIIAVTSTPVNSLEASAKDLTELAKKAIGALLQVVPEAEK
jgi:hypothetical protein